MQKKKNSHMLIRRRGTRGRSDVSRRTESVRAGKKKMKPPLKFDAVHSWNSLPELRRSVSGSRSHQHRRRYKLTACQKNKRRRHAPYNIWNGLEFSATVASTHVAQVQLITVKNKREHVESAVSRHFHRVVICRCFH